METWEQAGRVPYSTIMLLLLALACVPTEFTEAPFDADTGDTDSAPDTGDTSGAGDTSDTGENGETGDTDAGPPTFSRDVFPVYAEVCGDCHRVWGGPDDPERVYQEFVDPSRQPRPIVVAGDRDASWLYDKIAHERPEDGKEQMPPVCTHLGAEEITDLAAWIDAGAADDESWRTFYEFTWMSRHCHNCHEDWGGQDAEGVLAYLTTHSESDMALIKPGDSAASLLYLKVASDTPPFGDRMPLEFAKLDAATVESIGSWIDAGALND